MDILLLIIGVVVGALAGFALGNSRKSGAEAKVSMLEKMLSDQKTESDAAVERLKTEHKEELDTLKADNKEQLETQKRNHDEQLKVQLELLKQQLQTTAEKVLKERSEELSATNREQLSQILNPLQNGIKQMQDEVEKNRMERRESMSNLKTVIKQSAEQAEKLGQKTESLAHALSSDNKYQGSFGELQLRQMLEDMGFVRGKHFEEQVTLRDETGNAIRGEESGKRMQPDVILHFPDNRDVIIDSKVSLTAYLRYNDTSLSDAERQKALAEHVQSVKNQVRLLSSKSYWQHYSQKGVKLDFVVMFMGSEGALHAAMVNNASLWEEAFQQGVLITGPQNIYTLLRILELSWKQMAQVENQQNIIDLANEIVARVQMFYERFLDVESKFANAQKSLSQLKITISPTGPSIIKSANKLLEYGASEDPKRKKSLPKADEQPDEDTEEAVS
jgi:DNA recombination protein RmuC